MIADLDVALWESVPYRVFDLCKTGSDVSRRIRDAIKPLSVADRGYGYVFWNPDGNRLWVVLSDSDDQATHNRWSNALHAAGFRNVTTASESHPPDKADWVRIKTAAPLGFLGKAWDTGTTLLGGPNALATSLAGGLITGGLGYGAGMLAEQLFPDRILERGKLRRNLGLLGLGLGALPGVWQASANYRNAAAAGQPVSYLRSAIMRPQNVPVPTPQPAQVDTPRPWADKVAALNEQVPDIDEVPIVKAANDLYQSQAGGMHVPSVPVDAFNQAVWHDVRQGAARFNPYGTKSPWGNNQQPLHTPPELGAMTTGLMSGVQAMAGGAPLLSPATIVRGIASAGVGLATANLAGRTLSALAGLTPEAQRTLQNTGAFAGVLSAVVPPVFGY